MNARFFMEEGKGQTMVEPLVQPYISVVHVQKIVDRLPPFMAQPAKKALQDHPDPSFSEYVPAKTKTKTVSMITIT